MIIFRKISVAFIVLINLTSCGMPPLQPAGKITLNANTTEIEKLLKQQAEKCWARDVIGGGNGVVIDKHMTSNNIYVITAARFSPLSGVDSPFMAINIYGTSKETHISMNERKVSCGFTGCHSLHYSLDVQKWLDGDLSCIDKD